MYSVCEERMDGGRTARNQIKIKCIHVGLDLEGGSEHVTKLRYGCKGGDGAWEMQGKEGM